MAKAEKYVFSFGPSKTDGNAGMRALLGGKGANLAEMTNLGLPVPAGFTIGTNVCTYYYAHERHLSARAEQAGRSGPGQDRKGHGGQVRLTTNPLLALLPLAAPAIRCPA